MKILAGVLLVMFAVNTSADTEVQPYVSFTSENNPQQTNKASQEIVFTPNNTLHLLTGKVVTDIHAFDNFTKKVRTTYYKDSEAYSSASDEDSTKSLDDNYLEAGIDMSTINRWRANAAESEAAAKKLAKKPDAAIGMTKSQVRNKTNWGDPNYIKTTTNKYGTHEQWVYDDYQYLYFDNGKLTTIQQ